MHQFLDFQSLLQHHNSSSNCHWCHQIVFISFIVLNETKSLSEPIMASDEIDAVDRQMPAEFVDISTSGWRRGDCSDQSWATNKAPNIVSGSVRSILPNGIQESSQSDKVRQHPKPQQ